VVQDADGQPYRVRPGWFHDGLLFDFTHPQGVEWWLSKRAYLLEELGIDGFKTDGGEHLWGRGARFANGMRGDVGWNRYANLYVGAYHRFTRAKRNGDAITFSRAGSAGAQAFPCHWAGDECSTWDTLRGSLLAGLNAGLSGIPFWGWDLAGFSGEIPGAELYLRSAAMATFCPIMQYHMEYNAHRQPSRDRTPWNIAERTGRPEVIDIYRKFALLRLKLLAYIKQEANYCAETGEPLMRAMFLDWPQDPNAWDLPYQYSFGRALLVAPVVKPDLNEQQVYLPQGQWVNFWNGEPHQGGTWITCQAPLDEIPVFRRLDMPWPGLTD
jgi:alpha-glucosidase (family GH31 glycosyl hydrolase)